MTYVKLLRWSLPLFTGFAITTLSAAGSWAAPPPVQGVHITPIGSPTWRPVDFHLFSAPVGTAESGYVEFGETMLALLPSPNHEPHPALGIGPGIPHTPPYASELGESVAALGFREGVRFDRTEFSNGAGIWLVWMNVPAPGAVGSSPDFVSGPIIPNSLFPISVFAENVHNGRLFSVVAAFDVPAMDAIVPPFAVDGHSHFPIFIADNADFGPAGANLRGSYHFRISMVDQFGNGWRIVAHFAVAP
jgi:hypothetical protein